MSALEFTLLLLTFLISLSIIWNSLRAGITPVPSSRKARQAILTAADLIPAGTIIELGSGWGNLALALAKKYPQRQVIGFEISLVPWLFSIVLKQLQGTKNLSLRKQNFNTCVLPPATLLICYLYPGGMKTLAKKLAREKPAVQMLISNTFALPGTEPLQVIRLDDLYRSPIYVYRFPKEGFSEVEKREVKITQSDNQATVEQFGGSADDTE